jgi:hypothetical protein
MKLPAPAYRKQAQGALPGKVISFYIAPLDSAYGGAYGARSGQITDSILSENLSKIKQQSLGRIPSFATLTPL